MENKQIEKISRELFEFMYRNYLETGLRFKCRQKPEAKIRAGKLFIGNDGYCETTCWEGTDWKTKVYRIAFVWSVNNGCYIELSGTEGNIQRRICETIANKLGGFEEHTSKKMWFKLLNTNDVIAGAKVFIEKYVPKINKIIIENKFKGVNLLDSAYDKQLDKICRIVEIKERKVARLCWNKNGWHFPSGSEGKSVSVDSFEYHRGYGHEEWLLDFSKTINGYHYGYIQQITHSQNMIGKIIDLDLFTIHSENNGYYFIGSINDLEVIDSGKSVYAHDIYFKKGWIDEMSLQVRKYDKLSEGLSYVTPKTFFNVRYKPKNAKLLPDLMKIKNVDELGLSTHYTRLSNYKKPPAFLISSNRHFEYGDNLNDRGESTTANYEGSSKVKNLLHNKLQKQIILSLKKIYGIENVYGENDNSIGGSIDIVVKLTSGPRFYELKISATARQSIREALGQLLEYAYWPGQRRARELVVISIFPINDDITSYVSYLRNKFRIPLYYQYFDSEKMQVAESHPEISV